MTRNQAEAGGAVLKGRGFTRSRHSRGHKETGILSRASREKRRDRGRSRLVTARHGASTAAGMAANPHGACQGWRVICPAFQHINSDTPECERTGSWIASGLSVSAPQNINIQD
ncbi:MAG: hypothetical protein H6859_09945 [Rhodospirillales bacterium]|nr:hypothetical protein [Alphaproteobacteria bacterium]USO05446.1 MAG: hypothetical protein H6859_09945 [Rhodospirillales bacterium]